MSDTAARPATPARPGARGARGFHDSFALLAECLLTGVYVLIASLPVVTLPAALAAGTAHLRRHLTGEATDIGRFARDWWAAVRTLWAVGVGAVVLGTILTVNVQLAASGMLPGAGPVRWVSLAFAATAAVLLLRASGRWRSSSGGDPSRDDAVPGDTSRHLDGREPGIVRGGAGDLVEDPVGSLLLLLALALCGVLIWMLTPLVVVVGGLLCLAIVAVEFRRNPHDPADVVAST